MKRNQSNFGARLRQVGLRKITLLVVGLLLLVWVGFIAWHSVGLVRSLKGLKAQLEAPKPAQLVLQVHDAASDLNALRWALRPLYPVMRWMAPLPEVGPLLAQSPYLLDYAAGLAQVGENVLSGLSPLLASGAEVQGAASERVLATLIAGQEQFDAALPPLLMAASARSHIQEEVLPARFQPLFMRIDSLFDLIGPGLELLDVMPAMLGQDGPVNYLVLAQNRDELRPTGGFISGIGTITFDQGRMEKFDLGDSYRIDDFTKDYPPPPEPIQRFMLSGYWVPRDANWSPDFPTSARQAQSLYTLSTGQQTLGVIAFDQSAVRAILKVTGPVHLASFAEPVSEANIEQFMMQAWEPTLQEGLSQEWWEHRKDFMKELGSTLLKALTENLDGEKMAALVRQVNQLLEQGHLLVYFNDPSARDILAQLALDGAIRPGSGDFLQLVDTNMGFNKVDSRIQRALFYNLDLRDMNQPTAQLVVTYIHTGKNAVPCQHQATYGTGAYEDMQARCYWNYWRVYTAQGNQLVDGESPVVPAEFLLSGSPWPGGVEQLPEEESSAVFAGMMVLPASSQQQMTLSFKLPSERMVEQPDGQFVYRLHVAKQAGIDALPVMLHVRLPEGADLLPADGWIAVDGGWTWQGSLSTARDFVLWFTD